MGDSAMMRKDWTLLVIAAAAGQPVSPVQLQKALFLLGENLQLGAGFFHFTPYDYGPFDSAVYSEAESLDREGLVRIETPPFSYREYRATDDGRARADILRQQLPEGVASYLDQVVTWVRSRSFNDLVRAIYQAYPKMKANSVFRE
jgi:hypothetical protein